MLGAYKPISAHGADGGLAARTTYMAAIGMDGYGPVGAKSRRRGGGTGENDESFHLVLELVSQEPTIQNCLKIVESTCLAQGFGLKVEGSEAKEEFLEFIQPHYMRFLGEAIRAIFAYGFVPWRLRKLATGDAVPEVIPMGTFTWSVETSATTGPERSHDELARRAVGLDRNDGGRVVGRGRPVGGGGNGNWGDAEKVEPEKTSKTVAKEGEVPAKRRRNDLYERQQRALRAQPNPKDDSLSKLLRYEIRFVENLNIFEEEVEIHEHVPPTNNVTYYSVLHSTVMSPLAHLVTDYKHIRQAQIRMAHADAWNTRAKLVCSYAPASAGPYNLAEGNPITNDWVVPQNRLGLTTDTNLPTEIEQNAYARDAVMETITEAKVTEHKPIVYTLPKNSKLEATPSLTMLQNVEFMLQKFSKDAASVFGIPWELIGGGYTQSTASSKSLENTRIFTTNMMRLCHSLQDLLASVYSATYGTAIQDIKFSLRPTPRLEVQDMSDLAVLLESGLVTSADAKNLSHMILGMDLRQSMGKNPGEGNEQFITPKNENDAIRADAAATSSKASVVSSKAAVLSSEAAMKKASQPPTKSK